MPNSTNNTAHQPTGNNSPAQTGNASNPSPRNDAQSDVNEQILPKEAETYLREAGNIEDMPDAQDEEEAKVAGK